MEEITINISGCTTALQFLDVVSKVLGKHISTFSMLSQHLLANYYPQIIFVSMGEFSARCPHATNEVEIILKKVQEHYRKEKKNFEYEFR